MRKIKKCLACPKTTTRTWCWTCSRLYKKKKGPWSEETKKSAKPNSGRFKKGIEPWNKGKKYPQISDNKHPHWKGDRVGYLALHAWIARKLGKPNRCQNCNTTTAKRFEWANISGKYTRNLLDWQRLCSKCHAHEHKNWEKRWGRI